jgi:hypothetical protein
MEWINATPLAVFTRPGTKGRVIEPGAVRLMAMPTKLVTAMPAEACGEPVGVGVGEPGPT